MRQRSASVENHVEVFKKALAQACVFAQCAEQHREPDRHIEAKRARDERKVFDGALEQAFDGLTVINVETPAIGQHHVEVMRAAKDVVPGQPINNAWRTGPQKRHGIGQLHLIGAHHALRGHHGLRAGCRPRCHEKFYHAIRADFCARYIDIRTISFEQICKGRGLRVSARGDHLDIIQNVKRQSFTVLGCINHIGHARAYQLNRVAQTAVRTVNQRILLGHRHSWDPDILSRKRQQPVIYPIA